MLTLREYLSEKGLDSVQEAKVVSLLDSTPHRMFTRKELQEVHDKLVDRTHPEVSITNPDPLGQGKSGL